MHIHFLLIIISIVHIEARLKVVIFDKDNTLMSNEKMILFWGNYMVDEIVEQVPDANVTETLKESLGIKNGTLTGGVLSWGSYEQIIEALTNALTKATKYIKEKVQAVIAMLPKPAAVSDIPNLPKDFPPLCDLVTMLKKLKAMNLKIALVSANSRENTEKPLRKANVWNYFDYTLVGPEIKKMKPDPYSAKMIAAYFRVLPEEMIMVGDAPADIKMAVNAKLLAGVGVLTNNNYYHELKRYTKHFVKNVCELPDLIEKKHWLE